MRLESLVDGILEPDEEVAALEITDIVTDSREAKKGALFFALHGVNIDGSRFINDAANAGAVAAVTGLSSENSEPTIPVLRVENPRLALAQIASRFFPKQPETLAAVTGTAGKTSVATFLRQIWEKAGCDAASIGTTGVAVRGKLKYGNLTTPDPVKLHALLDQLAGDGITHASMEASSHGLDQYRLDGVRLAAGAFTNLGRDHMDYHSTEADYLHAKMRLFRDLLPKGFPAVIFADDRLSESVCKVVEESGLDLRTVGRKGDFISLKKVEHQRFKQIVEVAHDDAHYRIEFPLAGDFQIANGLVAAGLAISTGVAPAIAFKALESLEGASGRLELVGKSELGAPVYVDYAHKPEALENVLQSLRPFTSDRLILVFGCGGDRDPGKRPIMGEIAARNADMVIVTDDNPRTEDPQSIRDAIMAVAEGAMEVGDRAEAIHYACSQLREGDCLVVAGKGHEEGQIVGDKVLPFSDHQVVREALGIVS